MSRSNSIVLLILISIIVVVAVITFNGTGTFSNRSGTESVADALQPEGEFPYTDLEGNAIDLALFQGKTLVINSWATWCPFCVNELPDFEVVGSEFADEDVVVLAINRGEPQTTAAAFVEHVGSPKHITFLLDQNDRFYKSIGGFSMPETIFYRADGSVAMHKRGFMALEEMRQHVRTALTEATE